MATFKPGFSGNKTGRPKGALNKNTQLKILFEEHAEELIKKTIEMALTGDIAALKLCIERIVPKATDKTTTVVMPDLTTIETSKIIPALLKSLAGQELGIADFKNLLNVLIEHDSSVQQEIRIEDINFDDPIEASKAYQKYMQGL